MRKYLPKLAFLSKISLRCVSLPEMGDRARSAAIMARDLRDRMGPSACQARAAPTGRVVSTERWKLGAALPSKL